MKKFYAAFLVFVFVVVTPVAQAKSCILNGCQYVSNATFSSDGLYWTTGGGNGVTFPYASQCGTTTNKVAHLDNTEYIEQSFYVDDTYVEFSLNFNLWHLNDTNNFYDQLRITVTNDDTNVSEVFYIRGSSFTTNCSSLQQNYNLANDYSNANVTVKFDVSYSSLGQYEIDNVGFWGFQ